MKPRCIHNSSHYNACEFKGGLIVSYNRKQGGKHLTGNQAHEWLNAIETALCGREADALCKAILEC